MSDINSIVISGRLTKAAQAKSLPSGSTLVEFSIANNTGWGEYERTQFFDCKSFTKQAAALVQYLLKGKPVCVIGQFETERWSGQDGEEHSRNVLSVRDIVLMPDGKGSDSGRSEVGPGPAETYAQVDVVDDIRPRTKPVYTGSGGSILGGGH